MNPGRIVIVIPAHNEEESIESVIMGLRAAVPDYDRLVVNDGSADRTEQILQDLGERQLSLPFNQGYSSALLLGMKYTLRHDYDAVVFIDADGQHQPDSVRTLVNHLFETGADMVIGSRYCDGTPRFGLRNKYIAKCVLSWMTSGIIGKRIYDTTSGFKVIRARGCDALVNGVFMDLHAEAIVRLSLDGFIVREYPVHMAERLAGKSMYSFGRAIKYPVYTVLLTLLAAVDSHLRRKSL